jgi:hypothetical protein
MAIENILIHPGLGETDAAGLAYTFGVSSVESRSDPHPGNALDVFVGYRHVGECRLSRMLG